MRHLPPLVTTSGIFELPLADGTATRLIGALLTRVDRRAPLLAATLARDASWSLWALCRAAQRGRRDLRQIDQLAAWLAESVIDELAWPSAEEQTAATIPCHGAPCWADLATHSWAVAEAAAQLATRHGLDRERAYLLGLVHAAPHWLAGRADWARSVDSLPALPGWLRDQLRAVAASAGINVASEADAVAVARQAIGPERAADGALALPAENLPPAVLSEIDLVRRDWLLATDAARQLQELVAGLARLERLERKFDEALETAKLDALKELAYGAGHEINNPLANISARAQTLLQTERDPERRRTLAAINSQAFRAHEMIADLMLFARPPRPKLEAVDLTPLVAALVDELSPLAAEQETQFVAQLARQPIRVAADKTQLAVAVRALVVNALEALVHGGRVDIELAPAHEENDASSAIAQTSQMAQISVSDNGPGISPQTRPHIFEPFYSGREAGRGLGFGLPKCWRIVTGHGGRIEVENRPEGGSRFSIYLPLAIR